MDMHGQRQDYNRAFQMMREPGPGSLAVGYVCARLDLEHSTNLADQCDRRR
jgi:hypothetical protein